MTKRMILPLMFGIGGIAVLLWLAFWQLDRLKWKLDKISQIEQRMQSAPTSIPANPTEETDNYLRVAIEGEVYPDQLYVLTSQKYVGPGFRVVGRLNPGTNSLLVDLGFMLEEYRNLPPIQGRMRVTGNLLWPNEFDPSFTPEPDIAKNIWFARELESMAGVLDTFPVMVVADSVDQFVDGKWAPIDHIEPWPVTANITNDHLQYAITWFSLALVWFGMTLYLLWRIKKKTV